MPNRRTALLNSLDQNTFDLVIVGGGINGAAAAAALATRGARVALLERADFASGTSSQSSNLVWGGIKYLESHEYALVNRLCLNRNRLLKLFPNRIREIRFLASIEKGFRFWPSFIYLGSWFYWVLGRGKTNTPEFFNQKALKKLKLPIDHNNIAGAVEYSDAYLPDGDSRLVIDFIKSAWRAGAAAVNYVDVMSAEFSSERWTVQFRDQVGGPSGTITAKALVNCCGPGADALNQSLGIKTRHHHVLSKGVHLLVDRIVDAEKILAFFASDGRLFFVIPFGNRTCIGTTDTKVAHSEVEPTEEDREFILANANRCLDLKRPLTRADIIAERCGVRPLGVDGEPNPESWLKISRRHQIECNSEKRYASVFGGKLTDCLAVGEEICEHAKRWGVSLNDTSLDSLGEPPAPEKAHFDSAVEKLGFANQKCRGESRTLADRFWRRYGSDAQKLLEDIAAQDKHPTSLIQDADLYLPEICYLQDQEMAVYAEDILRRRTNIALTTKNFDHSLKTTQKVLSNLEASPELEQKTEK